MNDQQPPGPGRLTLYLQIKVVNGEPPRHLPALALGASLIAGPRDGNPRARSIHPIGHGTEIMESPAVSYQGQGRAARRARGRDGTELAP